MFYRTAKQRKLRTKIRKALKQTKERSLKKKRSRNGNGNYILMMSATLSLQFPFTSLSFFFVICFLWVQFPTIAGAIPTWNDWSNERCKYS